MIRQSKLKLLVAIGVISIGAILPSQTIAAPSVVSNQNSTVAQLFYPPANDQQIIAVVGQGHASVPADLARIAVALSNYTKENYERDPQKPHKEEPEPEPITESALNDILNSLKANGIPNDKIKVTIDPFKGRNATIEIEIAKPTKEKVARIVKSVNSAVPQKTERNKIQLENVYVQYTVNNCETVETAAYLAAVKDAKLRANALAKSMGVNLADVPSIAELPFLGRFWTACSQDPDITASIFPRRALPYNPDTLPEVELYREIAVTYRIR
ncbi:SIMPL domain-containing protein [Pseudanabaena sp. 'Roaring Creek']|uniref:SIMPL domain-containing protein n=1 Tax=Pseudanabaena sp. 'Roaring Creek' TaxID=1681830 RepID=UPI0006D7980F|nr:SIMPL domain-containing protein [Pseudanabaena sp. 'Roaring Creek']